MRQRLLIILGLVCLIAVGGTEIAKAFYRNYLPVHGNFQHTANLQGDDTPPGLPLTGKRILRGSTTIAEIDGNTSNGKEIAVGGSDGYVYVYHQDGSRLWEKQVSSCTPPNGDGLINTAPSVATIDGTTRVIVGYGPISTKTSCQGGIAVYNGATGASVWTYPIAIDSITKGGSVISTPAVGDVDGNGDVIMAFGATDGYFYVLNKNGTLRWRYRAMDTIWSSPALADVNGDGRLEIILGTDFTPGTVCTPTGGSRKETAQGFLYAFPADPSFTADPVCARDGGTTIYFDKGYLWKVAMDQTVMSSPAIADLDGDGSLEVIVGSGCYYGSTGRWVRIYSAESGTLERQLTAPSCVVSSPAIGDVNGDGALDIVAAVSSGGSINPPTTTPSTGGKVVAWSWNGTKLWEVVPLAATAEGADLSDAYNNPIIADVDGNGSHEVLITVQNSVTVLRGTDGVQLTSGCPPGGDTSASCTNSKSMWMWYPNRSTPAVGNIDNSSNGSIEVVSGGSHTSSSNTSYQNRAFLYAWNATSLSSPSGPYSAYSAPWPMFRGNPAHTGVYPSLSVPESLSVVLKKGSSTTLPIALKLSTGGSFSWTASESDSSSIVKLNRTSGTQDNQLQATLTAPSTTGTKTATITISSPGITSVTIQVKVISVESVKTVYLPSTVR